MSEIGKEIRYGRIVSRETGRTVIIPLDHGIEFGPVKGIEDPISTVREVVKGGTNAIIFQTGLAKVLFREYANKCGAIFKLTNACTAPQSQFVLSSVERAIKLGADAVSIQFFVGSPHEKTMLENARITVEMCYEWGVPMLVMAYPVQGSQGERDYIENVKLGARASAEFGADIVKVPYTGDIETFRQVVEGCPVPLVLAGGGKTRNEREFLQVVKDAVKVGAIGVAAGRNVWQHKNPSGMVKALSAIIHEESSVEDAMNMLRR